MSDDKKYYNLPPARPETITEAIAVTRMALHMGSEEKNRLIEMQRAALAESQQYWATRRK